MSSFVYFIQSGPGGPVKIGHTVDVEKRLASLQTGCPDKLDVLGVIKCDNGRAKETELHRRFTDLRINHSEWFRWSPTLADAIAKEAVRGESPTRVEVSVVASSLGLSVIQLPNPMLRSFQTEAKRNGKSPWTMLYLWLCRSHNAGRNETLHNRARVGDLTMEKLLDVERTRINAAFRAESGRPPTAAELRETLMWSNIGGGPMTTEPGTGRHLIGEGLFVLPEDIMGVSA